jgi:D-alanine-D-alanine ligase
MKRVAVLYNDDGGLLAKGAAEDRIAWGGGLRPARAIAEALGRAGFTAHEVACGDEVMSLVHRLEELSPDLIFNICESFHGESGLEAAMASLLEMLQIPFTGNDPLALGMAHDKVRCKELLRSSGLPIPEWRVFPREKLAGLTPPLIVKPRSEDGSHGLSAASVCASPEAALKQAAQVAALWRQDCLIEEFLPGREFNVGVLFDGMILPASEIEYQLPAGLPNLVTYEAKWIPGSVYDQGTPVRCPAANLGDALAERLGSLALQAYRLLGCRDYARIDIRLDSRGDPRILEVNPNPDLSPDAGLARAAAKGGLHYDELISRIAGSAIARAATDGARTRAR